MNFTCRYLQHWLNLIFPFGTPQGPIWQACDKEVECHVRPASPICCAEVCLPFAGNKTLWIFVQFCTSSPAYNQYGSYPNGKGTAFAESGPTVNGSRWRLKP